MHAVPPTHPLAGHIVRFPTAIPSSKWMADRMLWADRIGAVWPTHEPTPTNEDEEAGLSAVRLYKEAGFFTECVVPPDAFEGDTPSALRLSQKDHRLWLDTLPEVQEGVDSTEAFRRSPDSNFYINKLGPDVAQMLLDAGIATPKDDHFIKLKSAAAARRLMATVAAHARAIDGTAMPLTLDAAKDTDLAAAATPSDDGNSYLASVVNLPVIVAAKTEDPQRIIEFRLKTKNERARQDYFDAVEEFVAKQSYIESVEPASAEAEQIRKRKILGDLLEATTDLTKIHGRAGILAYGTVGASVLLAVPGATDGTQPALQLGVSSAAFAAATVLIRGSRETRYLRRGWRDGVIAAPQIRR